MKFTFTRPDFTKIFTIERKYTIAIGEDDNDTTTLKMPVFEDGPLEAALYWRKQFEELATMKNWNATSKFTNVHLLLSGDAKDKWVDAQEDALGDEEATDLRFTNTMDTFIRKCGATVDTAEDLRDFLMNARKPVSMPVQTFKRRLTELNRYLPFLPGPLNEKLSDDTLFSTVKRCVPSWHQMYIRSNARAMIGTMDELIDYYEALEEQESNNRNRRGQNNPQNAIRRNNSFNRSDNNSSNRDNRKSNNQTSIQHKQSDRNRGSVWCDYHKTSTHANQDCRAQQRQQNEENDTSDRNLEKNENQPRHRYYTRSQARIAANNNNDEREEHHQHQESHNTKDDAKSKASSDDSSSNESLYATMENTDNQQTIIQSNAENFVPELIVGILTKVTPPEYKYLRALIDSGSSRSILSAASLPTHMQSIIKDDNDGSITWSTKAGTFETKQTATVIFQLAEFAHQQHFLHTFKIDSTSKQSTYDIIVGRDLFKTLKLDLKWSSTVPLITLDNHQINMKPHGFWTRTNIQNLLQSLKHSSNENYEITTQEIFSTSSAQQVDKNISKFPTTTDEVKTHQIVSTLHAKESAKISQTTTNIDEHASQHEKFKANAKNEHGRKFSISTVPYQHLKTNHIQNSHHGVPKVIKLQHSVSHSAISTKNEDLTKCDNNSLADMTDKETITKFSTYRVKLKSPITQTGSNKSSINGTDFHARGHKYTERPHIRHHVPYFA
jgi:hypothetical protein